METNPKPAYTILSNEDDSITLECGSIRAEIRGSSWADANQAAHLLALGITSKREIERLSWQMKQLQNHLREMTTFSEGLDQRILELVRDLNKDRTVWARLQREEDPQ